MAERPHTATRIPADVTPAEWHARLAAAEPLLAALAREHGLAAIWVYGSVLREDFHTESDVDLAVDFNEGTVPGFAALAAIEAALTSVLGRPVHVVRRRALEQSDNPAFRSHVLSRLKRWERFVG